MLTTRPGLAFHHLGVACTDLAAETAHFAALGYIPASAEFIDPRQRVRGVFLEGPSPRLELVAPIDPHDDGLLGGWLRRGVKLYHMGYETPDLAGGIAGLRAQRAKLVLPPTPAVAFAGREVAFLLLPNMALVELIAAP